MNIDTWLAFLSIALVATAVPGPAILLVITHNLQYGTARSLFTICGNITGLLLMSGCSVLGLTTLVMVSANAFTLIKTAGALYLIWMGIKLWRNGVRLELSPDYVAKPASGKSLYLQGILIALTNPKAIVFTSALFPQFIDINQPLMAQFPLLVLTLMACSILCLFGYSQLARQAKNRSQNRLSETGLGQVFGSMFIGAGTALAWSEKN